MAILPEVADTILAKCGRCCCLCRRFKPVRLQVHHIVERSEGGSDDEDNLIAVCITCHIDVHTKAPFTRRFSVGELQQHRDNVFRLVADGKLPAAHDPAFIEVLPTHPAFSPQFRQQQPSLSPKAIAILISTANIEHGTVLVMEGMGGWTYQVGAKSHSFSVMDRRQLSEFQGALRQLVQAGLFKREGEDFAMTHEGYLLADVLQSSGHSSDV